MAQNSLFPIPNPQFLDENGNPYAGGKLYFYEPGTTTLKAAYSDSNGTTTLANPVILDSAGRANIWLDGFYKTKLTDSNDSEIWTVDNVSSQFSDVDTDSQFILQSDTLTYSNATQFTVPTDRTAGYQEGRRIKAVVTAGTIYGTVANSVAAGAPAITTVTSAWDSGNLDSGLASVYLGFATPIDTSLPVYTVLEKAANYTIAANDTNKIIQSNSANNIDLTLANADAVVSGTNYTVQNISSGTTTLVGTINGAANLSIAPNQFSQVYSDGTSWRSTSRAVGYGLYKVRTFVVGSATYTPTAGTRAIEVECLAGGGGGGGGGTTSNTECSAGGGGGGGGYAKLFIDSANLAANYAYVVGAGGAGGAYESSGSNGANTTFGAIVTCNFGQGGGMGTTTYSNSANFTGGPSGSGGAGGTAAGGNLIVNGTAGKYGILWAHQPYLDGGQMPGDGASSIYGAGGQAFPGSNSASGSGNGSGGGGASSWQGAGYTGGNGAAGLIVIHEYI